YGVPWAEVRQLRSIGFRTVAVHPGKVGPRAGRLGTIGTYLFDASPHHVAVKRPDGRALLPGPARHRAGAPTVARPRPGPAHGRGKQHAAATRHAPAHRPASRQPLRGRRDPLGTASSGPRKQPPADSARGTSPRGGAG